MNRKNLKNIGVGIGLLFQIIDDLIDYGKKRANMF